MTVFAAFTSTGRFFAGIMVTERKRQSAPIDAGVLGERSKPARVTEKKEKPDATKKAARQRSFRTPAFVHDWTLLWTL